jgi:hypothetical protein
MHVISDVQLYGGAGIIVVHFLTSTVGLLIAIRKSYANGRGIQQNHVDITGVAANSKANAADMATIRQALARIQARIDTASPNYGRRGTDALPPRSPEPAERPPPQPGPAYDPKAPGIWPIGA